MRIRIKDIALKAGVSVGTVDRVIHKRGRVAPGVQSRVEEVMNELGYRRNIIASTLAYNRTLNIQALISDNCDYYWEQIRMGIDKAQEGTLHYGVEVIVSYCNDPKEFVEKSNAILDAEPDGVLFAPIFREEGLRFIDRCNTLDIPVALINTQVDAPEALCYIGQDSYQSGIVAARLLNFGVANHSTALLINIDSMSTNAQHLVDKERGFRDYFDGIDGKEVNIITANFDHALGKGAFRDFLGDIWRDHPGLGSVFVTNSRAYMLVECLPEDLLGELSIVGFDLIEPNIKYLKGNRINFLINQNPIMQGYMGILNIVNHLLLKEDVKPIQYLPLDIVVLENCAYYVNGSIALPAVV